MNTRNLNVQHSAGALSDSDTLAIPCETFTLENGLTVIVYENHQSPVVAVNVWYRVGAKDEPAGKTGFAHLFEHLMFGGSGNLPGSYLERMLEAGALQVNGTTSRDRTNYYQTVPLEALDFALFAESDRMGHFLEGLQQDVLDRQLNVVLNEKQERESAPYGMASVRSIKACFPVGHPYAHTVLGEEADLKNATLEDARAWFQRWYRPSNAVLTLAGAIDLATAKEKVSRFFAHIPTGEPLQRPAVWVSAIRGGRREILEDRVTHARVMLSWNLPPYGDADTTALLLLPQLLTHGVLSVMHRQLVQESAIATFVNAWIDPGLVCSQLTISAQAQNGASPAELEAAILAILADFIASGTPADNLERVREVYMTSALKSYSTVTDIADLLSFSVGMLGDAQGYNRLLNSVATVSGETLRQTAARWLNEDRYSLHIIPFTARSAEIPTPSREVPPIVLSGEFAQPELLRARLDNGMPVIFSSRPQQPETLISLVIPRGSSWDVFATAGAGQLLSQLLSECGAGDFTADEIADRAERLGADMDVSIGQDNMLVTLRALTSRLGESLALFSARVRHSHFTEQEFERSRSRKINRLESHLNTADGMVSLLLSQTLFSAGHPYAQPLFGSGTPATLAEMSFTGLSEHQQRLLVPDGAQLVIAGSGDFDALISQLNTLFGDWRSESASESLVLPALTASPAAVYLIDKPGVSQTTIAAASLIPPGETQDDAAFNLLHEALLNGFASRLNASLREKHNWTYGVHGILTQARAARIQGFYTTVQADCSGDALNEVLHQLTAIDGDRPVTAEELEKFRRGELLRLRGGSEGVGQQLQDVRFIVVQQKTDDYWQRYAQQLSALTTDDLQRLAATLIKPLEMAWVVVADMAESEADICRALPPGLPVIRLKDNDLPGLSPLNVLPQEPTL
ncbi:M16 family metallopeptidase [Pantoea coffeiphila]|uniref:M16 family metallopeptidase n=1 Tax=Pantoea coffeiphila TaxID=1465635 RepID=UPI0019601ACF|nr:pitrilysin family protein [Pantoea coffeiphila]MBM7341415.1 putative Zn-dependent peptidase [Pantoea coffeiphila]